MESRTRCLRPFRLPRNRFLRPLRSCRVPAETHRHLPGRGSRHSPVLPRHSQHQPVEHSRLRQTHGAPSHRTIAAGHPADLGSDGTQNHPALPEKTFPFPSAPGSAGQPMGRLRTTARTQRLCHARDDRRALFERRLVPRGRQRSRCPNLREGHRTSRRSHTSRPGCAGDPRGERQGGWGTGVGSPRPSHSGANPSRASCHLERRCPCDLFQPATD